MKRVILCAAILFFVSGFAIAQTAKKKNTKTDHTTQKKTSNEKQHIDSGKKNSTYTLSNSTAHHAFGRQSANNSFQIADPAIKLFNARANGATIKVSPSGLVGVPKGTYGFANGKIVLYPNGATSIGTTTGSGSVGTGSSPGSIGTLGPALGVNGKSPYTGTGPYGTRVPLIVETSLDSGKTTGIKRN